MKSLRERFTDYNRGGTDDVNWTEMANLPSLRQVECADCNDAGFVVLAQWSPDGKSYSEQAIPCPNPACPIVQRNTIARYDKLVSKAPLPAEYCDLHFEDWRRLLKREPDKLTGKWLGLGSALAFVDRAQEGYWFLLSEAYEAVRLPDRSENPYRKNSIVLSGPPGVGKTSLAACVVNHLREQTIPALYMRVSAILDALREPMNDDKDYLYEFGRTEQQILATFSRAPVLVLDEFNLARTSDYSKQKLEDIIRYRMANQLPTVMTTNLTSFEDFNEHWGYRVGHAVQGMAHWIVMSGPELRRRGGPVESV